MVPSGSRLTGNTKSQPVRVSPGKHWVFTLNNHTEGDIKKLRSLDGSKVPVLVFQEEIGESGTKHLQGCLTFKTKGRPKQFVGISRIHWEKKSPRSTLEQARGYCCDESKRMDGGIVYMRGYKPPEPIHTFEPRGWQIECKEHLEKPKHRRTILWFWDERGGNGKTEFCRWACINLENTIALGGRGIDMKYAIAEYMEKTSVYPDNILINVPKNGHLDLSALEEIKDAFFFSSKYKSGQVIGNPPRVIVFANYEPDDKLNNRIQCCKINIKISMPHPHWGGGVEPKDVDVEEPLD